MQDQALGGAQEILPQQNWLIQQHPQCYHRPPWRVLDHPQFSQTQTGHPLPHPSGSGRNPSLASSGPAPQGPELHGAWGPGGLKKRKWGLWGVREGQAGPRKGPTLAPWAQSLPPGPPGALAATAQNPRRLGLLGQPRTRPPPRAGSRAGRYWLRGSPVKASPSGDPEFCEGEPEAARLSTVLAQTSTQETPSPPPTPASLLPRAQGPWASPHLCSRRA